MKMGDVACTLMRVKQKHVQVTPLTSVLSIPKYLKMNIINPNRSPVRAFHVYSQKRLCDLKSPNDPFYLSVNMKRPTDVSPWLKRQAMGHDRIGQSMHRMAKSAGLFGRLTIVSEEQCVHYDCSAERSQELEIDQ